LRVWGRVTGLQQIDFLTRPKPNLKIKIVSDWTSFFYNHKILKKKKCYISHIVISISDWWPRYYFGHFLDIFILSFATGQNILNQIESLRTSHWIATNRFSNKTKVKSEHVCVAAQCWHFNCHILLKYSMLSKCTI
jgi:hypothetical protein